MDRLLKPERLDTDPNSSSASKEWTHWLKTFQNFMSVLPTEGLNKLCVLTNYVTPKIYESFAECATYDDLDLDLDNTRRRLCRLLPRCRQRLAPPIAHWGI